MSISQIPTDSTLSSLIREVEATLASAEAPSPSQKEKVVKSPLPSREATGDVERLGSITKESTTYEQKEKYRKLDASKSLLPHGRVGACLEFVVPGELGEVRYNDDMGKGSFSNIGVCGNVWTCPVCSERINLERGQELERAMEHAELLWGGEAILITMTIQHGYDDKLADLLDMLKGAWAKAKSGRSWSLFRERHGVLGYVTATEILHGANGWHPHLHVLMFLDHKSEDGELLDMEEWLKHRWSLKVSNEGGYSSMIYGLTVRRGNSAAKYITKWGSEFNWDISREMTGLGVKVGHGLSPFQLLDKFSAGDERAGHLFVEYAEATKGRAQLRYSRGLKDLLLMDIQLTDADLLIQSLERERSESRLVLQLTNTQWQVVARQRKFAELLDVVETCKGDAEVTWSYLRMIGVQPSRIDKRARDALDALSETMANYEAMDLYRLYYSDG